MDSKTHHIVYTRMSSRKKNKRADDDDDDDKMLMKGQTKQEREIIRKKQRELHDKIQANSNAIADVSVPP